MILSLRATLLIILPIIFFGLLTSHWVTTSAIIRNDQPLGSGLTVVQASRSDSRAWTLTAVGDIMLDRHIRTVMQKSGADFPFEKIQSSLVGDLVIGNLEGPFTNNQTVATDTHLVFTFDPATAPVLSRVGFTHLSLANNHTLNFGQAGLDNTRQVLTDNNLHHFGDPRNGSGFGHEMTVGVDRVALIGFHGLVGGIDHIEQDIRQAKSQGMFVIVMPHWGSEYQLGIQSRLRTQAHRLVDAGADLIIGAHPHVVEPLEIYQGKLIAYSLGNFLFDQYFSVPTQEGLLLSFKVYPVQIVVQLVPIRTTNQQVQLLTGSRRDTLLERLAQDSIVPDDLRLVIQQGNFTLSR